MPPFDLGRSNQIRRWGSHASGWAAAAAFQAAARDAIGGALPAGSPATAKRASGHQTIRGKKLPKRRGGHEKITWGLGREGGAPEKRIGSEGRAPAGRFGGGRSFGGAGDLRHEELE
jgi:hypothetical protein